MSPVITPDFGEALDMSPIAEGIYSARAVAFTPKNSSTGNPMLEGDVEVTVDGKVRDRKVYWPTSGKGAGSYQQYLRAIGREDLAAGGVPVDTDEIVNIEFTAVIEHQREGQYAGRDFIANCLKM